MRKKLLGVLTAIALIMISAFATGCSKGSSTIPTGPDEDVIIDDEITVSPEEYGAKNAVYAVIGRLSKLSTYTTTSSGTSVASVAGLFNYVQKTDCFSIKHGDEFYSESNSVSKFVSVKHEAFAKGDNIAYRVNGGTISNSSADAYKEVYGVTPEKLLSGHVFNDESIKYAKVLEARGDEYDIEIVLDKEKGNLLLYKQMKEFGGLNGYPVFSDDTTCTLTIKSDYTPVKFTYKSEYKVNVSVLGNLPCEENNEVIFSDFNGEVTIPDAEKFNAAMDSTPSEVIPTEEKPVDENRQNLVSALLNADIARGVALNGIVSVNGKEIPLKLAVRADVDKIVNDEDADVLSSIDFTASFGVYEKSLSLTYHDKKLFLNLGDMRFVRDVLNDEDTSKVLSSLPAAVKNSDISSKFSLSKNDEVYEIKLNDLTTEVALKTILKQFGLMGQNSKQFDMTLGMYVPSDRVGVVSFNLTTDVLDFRAKLNLSDEKFVLPDLSDYYSDPQILRAGAEAEAILNLPKLGQFEIKAQAFVSYDLTKENTDDAFKAEVGMVLNEDLKNALKDKTGIWSEIGNADDVHVLFANGKILLVTMRDGVVTTTKDITPNDANGENGESGVVATYGGFEPNSIIPEYESVKEFAWSFIGGEFFDTVTQNLKSEAIRLVNETLKTIPEFVEENQIELPFAIEDVLYPVADAGIVVAEDGSSVKIFVDAYDVYIGSEDYVEGGEYEKFRIFECDVKCVSATDYRFGWNVDELLKSVAGSGVEEPAAQGDAA